jgi:hypothetical protein
VAETAPLLRLLAGAAGLVLLSAGLFLVVMALRARAQIDAGLRDEAALTGAEADIPRVPIVDARTAASQVRLIRSHTVGRYGHYGDLPRDDPNRDHYLKGLTLRNALNLAILGYGVADLALATGAGMGLTGLVLAAGAAMVP